MAPWQSPRASRQDTALLSSTARREEDSVRDSGSASSRSMVSSAGT